MRSLTQVSNSSILFMVALSYCLSVCTVEAVTKMNRSLTTSTLHAKLACVACVSLACHARAFF